MQQEMIAAHTFLHVDHCHENLALTIDEVLVTIPNDGQRFTKSSCMRFKSKSQLGDISGNMNISVTSPNMRFTVDAAAIERD